jgi:hypothetical protein
MPMEFSLQPARDSALARLPQAAQALVVALRGWVAGWRAMSRGEAGGQAQWGAAWSTFATCLGPSQGRVATGTAAAFLATLAAGVRRPLDIRPACSPRLSHDEHALLALVRHAERCRAAGSSPGQECHARAIWLVHAGHVRTLIEHAADLGTAVTATGLTLADGHALEACQKVTVPLVVPPLSEAGD